MTASAARSLQPPASPSPAGTPQTLRTRVAALEAKATTAVDGKPGAAASLAILVKAMHLNPKSFGGANLVDKLLAGIDPTTGQVGSFGSAYGQALAIIALKRAKAPVPAPVVALLLTFQDASGAFGYEFNGFVADPDSTALAIQALHLLGGHSTEIKKAVVLGEERPDQAAGYWGTWLPRRQHLADGFRPEAGAPQLRQGLQLAAHAAADGRRLPR